MPMMGIPGANSMNGMIQKRDLSLSTLMDPVVASTVAASAATVGGLIYFTLERYRVSQADQYLIRTGLGIHDISVSKQGYQWPFQSYRFINLHPTNYTFDLSAMSSEKLEFILPGSYTIGPKDDPEAIMKYAKLLLSSSSTSHTTHVDELVKGILEGETRLQSASMTIEQIFNDRKAFKDILIKNVQEELDQFGLIIYNANIKEMQDSKGSEYFSFIRQKKRSEAENRAKIDIAEAKKTGDIGQKEREATTRQQLADYEAQTILRENERKQDIEKSTAELAVVQSEMFQKKELAKIEAVNASKIREAELQKEVEQKRIFLETEKMRATDMSKTQVSAEMHIKQAEGEATALKVKAEAELFAKRQEAEGILAIFNAQSSGIEKLIDSFGGNREALIQYLMLDKGLYEKLAHANADAIQGLQPKITLWQTTSDSSGESNVAKQFSDIFKMLPPLLTTINDQTGVKPADWLINLPKEGLPSKSKV
ncbi:MAG: SPFH domain-containing protein, partial [Methanotrichaceae archaeon]|nr:SPFH domain-containing protein [Methanotrichaceae archaeon]